MGSTRGQALARHLESKIATLGLVPGDRLGTRTELRQSYSVGVATVNEALRLMTSRGIVEARPGPGGGVFVANREGESEARLGHALLGLEATEATLNDCVECRMTIEPAIYRHAAECLGPEDIEALEVLVATMASSLDDQDAFLEANWAFHRRVAAVCDNRLLRATYLALIDILEAGLEEFAFGSHGLDDAEVHSELTAAMANGDAQRLARAVKLHAALSPLPA